MYVPSGVCMARLFFVKSEIAGIGKAMP